MEDNNTLKRMAEGGSSIGEVAEKLKRSYCSVQRRAQAVGVNFTAHRQQMSSAAVAVDKSNADATEKMVAQLVSEGKSYGKVADALGMTRGQVAGIAFRVGVKRPEKDPQPARRADEPANLQKLKYAMAKAAVTPTFEPNSAAADAVISLGSSRCCWPSNDPQSPEFEFCGASAVTIRFRNGTEKKIQYCFRHYQMSRVGAQGQRVA